MNACRALACHGSLDQRDGAQNPRHPLTPLLSSRALLPAKCCGNKKQRSLRCEEGEAVRTRGREARGAGARRSSLSLQAPVASTPSRPRSATGRTKAARCAPRGLSASRPGPASERHQPAPGPAGALSHARCCAPRCASAPSTRPRRPPHLAE